MVECGPDSKRATRERAPSEPVRTATPAAPLLERPSLPTRTIFWHNAAVPSTPLASPDAPGGSARDGAPLPPSTILAIVPLTLTAGAVAWAGAVTLWDFSPAWPGVALAVAGFAFGRRVGRPLLRGGIQFVAAAACIALFVQIAAVAGAAWAIKKL